MVLTNILTAGNLVVVVDMQHFEVDKLKHFEVDKLMDFEVGKLMDLEVGKLMKTLHSFVIEVGSMFQNLVNESQ